MAKLVNPDPALPKPTVRSLSLEALRQFDLDLLRNLVRELQQHAVRLNNALMEDGTEGMNAPLVLASYTVAGVPTASLYTRGLIYVSNETGGAVPAFSDGTNWRRVTDRAVIA